MERHAIGYVRVSTDLQECSVEIQRERINDYCRLHSLTLDAILVDEDVSGHRYRLADRPEGSRIAAMIASGVTHVVAMKLDRLFRRAADALTQVEEWEKDGVSLHLIDMGGQSINTGTAMGKMMLTMLAGFAEFERNLIAERTTAALQHKKANGRVYSHVPFGKLRVDGDRLVDDPSEQGVIDAMKRLRTSGMSYQRIADDLNSRAVPSKKGGVWYSKTVRSMVAA